jgi:hypothetical protein
MTTTQTDIKSRSYQVREDIAPATRVRVTHDHGRVLAGQTGTIINYSNAGFRGIEAYVELDQAPTGWEEHLVELAREDDFWANHNPRRFSVSAGVLERL